MIEVKAPTLAALRQRISRQQQWAVPYAAAATLTQVAENARMTTIGEMKAKLHAPTDWTLQSMWKRPATARSLWAMVYLKDGGGKRRYVDDRYPAMGAAWVSAGQDKKKQIGHLFGGGQREWKGFEARLKGIGVLPKNMAAVPGAGAPLDGYGNMPRGFLIQMLAYFEAYRTAGYRSNMDDKGRKKFGKKMGEQAGIGGAAVDYFMSRGRGNWFGRGPWAKGRLQHLPPGIWMRAKAAKGTSLKPIIMFVKRPSGYKQYFDLPKIVETAMARDFDMLFDFNFNRIKDKDS